MSEKYPKHVRDFFGKCRKKLWKNDIWKKPSKATTCFLKKRNRRFHENRSEILSRTAARARSGDFSRPRSRRSAIFSPNNFKSRCVARGCLKKVRKTSGRSAVQAENDNPFNEITDFGTILRIWRIWRIWRICRKRWQQGQGRPPSHTRRGPG